MGRASHDSIKDDIVQLLRANGGSMGNYPLMEKLRCNADTYWKVKSQLIEEGLVVDWKGRGGSLKLVEVERNAPTGKKVAPATDEPESTDLAERKLYGPIVKVLEEDWAPDKRINNFVIERTASQGRRRTGGTWSRPDIVLASIEKLSFVPGMRLDLISFEVKASSNINLVAVYEAVAHLRYANKAYVLLHVPKASAHDDRLQERIKGIEEEAVRHGVGLIVAEDVSDYSTWTTRAEAERHDTDPFKLNDFIQLQFTEENKRTLEHWCHGPQVETQH